MEWEEDDAVPDDFFATIAKHGMHIPTMGAPLPVEHLKNAGINGFLNAVTVEEFDYLHFLIYTDEVGHD